jgi:D-glycero-D-manno-heptose 1,7-bisphosphate phosphatase
MKLVILDRDGVINQDSVDFIKGPDEWHALPGSLEAIARLNHEGYKVAVATNQSGLARGLFDLGTLNAIHQRMHNELQQLGGHVDAIFFCPHGPGDRCDCRKPAPGLYLQISQRFGRSLDGVWVIGDSRRDLEAAITVGARPVLVRTGKGCDTERVIGDLPGVPVFDDLRAAVDAMLASEHTA